MAIFLVVLIAYVALMIYLNVKVEPDSKLIPAHLETPRKVMSLSRNFPKLIFIGIVATLIKEFILYIFQLFGFA